MKNDLLLSNFLLLIIISCQDKKETISSESPVLVQEIIPSRGSGGKTLKFQYSGNKILNSTDSDGYKVKYYYSGDKIVKREKINNDNEICLTEKYEYVDNRLDSCLKSEPGLECSYRTKYTYNPDGTVLYQEYSISTAAHVEKKEDNSGKFTFENGNLIKHEQSYKGSKKTTVYQFDTNKNCWKNILGLNVLFDLDFFPSLHNVIKESNIITSEIHGNSIYTNTNYYKYNSEGFPVEKKTIYEYKGNNGSSTVTYKEKFKY